jgi:glycosyltransferase involved in cell wall biosynthesis
MDSNLISTSPRVTVLMPVYNAEKYLHEAIQSILNQTWKDFEFLIINDGSTDSSEQIILSYSDNRIRYYTNPGNLGIIETLNKGIQLSNGEYIARMDADDISLETRLEKQIHFLDNNPAVAVVATKLIEIDEHGEELGYWQDDIKAVTFQEIKSLLPKINCIGHPSILARKSTIEKFGYTRQFTNSEDWCLWLELLAESKIIAKLDHVLLKYRIHHTSTTHKANKKSIQKKIILFKYRYIKRRFSKTKFKNTDYSVAKYFLLDCIKYFLSPVFLSLIRTYRKGPLKTYKEYISVMNSLKQIDTIHHAFFFPYYHIGGAEKVHLAIVSCIADENPVVFFTRESNNDMLRNSFHKNARCIDIYRTRNFPILKNRLNRAISQIINNTEKATVFGCNSEYYYQLLPHLNNKVRCIDLIHAFGHKNEIGPEHWALQVIPNLSNRVIITRSTLADFKKLYKESNIAESFLNRIVCIPNYVQIDENLEKNNNSILKLLYVGRDTFEKRTHIIELICEELNYRNIDYELSVVGNFKNPISNIKISFKGEISDSNELKKLYVESDILLLTSSREGFPLVIMEAMSNATLPISTNVGGISDHITNYKNGILINSKDEDLIVKDFVSAIERLNNDRGILKKISMNAYVYAKNNFRYTDFNNAYRKLLLN